MTTIYCFASNGNYIGQNVVPTNPKTGEAKHLPENATTTPPPGPGAKWNGKKWVMPTVTAKSAPGAPKASQPGDLAGPVVDATDLPDPEDKGAKDKDTKSAKDTKTLDLTVKKSSRAKKADRP